MSKNATHLLVTASLAASLLVGCGSAQVEAGSGGDGTGDGASGTAEGGEASGMERIRWFVEQAGVKRIEGDIQGALDLYLEAASLCESIITVECADVHYEAAGIAYERMERDMSIAEYGKAVDIYLRFGGNSLAKAAVALNSVGVMYREMAEKTKARNAFEHALQIYSETPDEFKSKANIEKIKQNIRALDEGYH